MRTWIKSPLAIFTGNTIDAENGIVIEDQRISELVARGCSPESDVDEVFDATSHVVLPGLINTHHHYYQTLTRAVPIALNKALFPWLTSQYPIWAGLTEEMIHVSTRLACAELMLSGFTTSSDHHYQFTDSISNAMDVQVDAVREIGIRAVITRGSMSLGRKDGGLPPDNTVQEDDEILRDCQSVIQKFHDPGPGSMLQIALAPCSPFSVTRDLMTGIADLARQNRVRLHTHLAETRDETSYCMERFNCRPLDYLDDVNWLAEDVWLAHGIFFDDDEIQRLGSAGTGIAHCPTSNMMLGSGQCRVLELQASGCSVGIGVDGSASNDCSNMMQEIRQAFLLQRLQYGSDQVSHEHVLTMAGKGSAGCLGRDDIGSIGAGKQADLSLFKLDELRFSGAGDPLAALVLCGADTADHVMIDGQWKVINGEMPGVDLDALKSKHRILAHTLQHAIH
jgi:8-oxoguanine deaminase